MPDAGSLAVSLLRATGQRCAEWRLSGQPCRQRAGRLGDDGNGRLAAAPASRAAGIGSLAALRRRANHRPARVTPAAAFPGSCRTGPPASSRGRTGRHRRTLGPVARAPHGRPAAPSTQPAPNGRAKAPGRSPSRRLPKLLASEARPGVACVGRRVMLRCRMLVRFCDSRRPRHRDGRVQCPGLADRPSPFTPSNAC